MHTEYGPAVTASAQNPYSAVPTGTCLVCGEPISYQARGRPRLYCDRVRCRRRGARRRALATAWEEGRAAARLDLEAAAAASAGPTYEDGVQAGRMLGEAEAIGLLRRLVDNGADFINDRNGPAFLALDQAVTVARRWLDAQEADAEPRTSSSKAEHSDQKTV